MSEEKPPDWIANTKNTRPRTWDAWTNEMKQCVLDAIKWRERGYTVSAAAVAEQIVSLGGHAEKDSVDRYCREVLGRKSLARA